MCVCLRDVPVVEVTTLNSGRERTLSWVFEKPGQDSSTLMNLVNLPMKNAVATKKMMKQQASAAKDSKKQVDELKRKVESVFIQPGVCDADASKGGAGHGLSGDNGDKKRKSQSECHEPNDGSGGANNIETEDCQDGLDSTAQPGKKTKLAHKKSSFSGYSKTEKEVYSFVVKGDEEGDTRHCTALDEVLQALKFASHYLDHLEATKNGKSLETGCDSSDSGAIPSMLTASWESLTCKERSCSSSFCIGFFLEFLFQGKVCVNGKDCRAYSNLRVELQNILIKCNENFSVEVTEMLTDPKGKRQSSTSTRTHTALELAELLTSTYMSHAATHVDFGGDDEEVDEEDMG